jgi:hypothetical protein
MDTGPNRGVRSTRVLLGSVLVLVAGFWLLATAESEKGRRELATSYQ